MVFYAYHLTDISRQCYRSQVALLTRYFLFSLGISISAFVTSLAAFGFAFNKRLGYFAHRLWGQTWLWVYGVCVSVKGLENIPKNQGYILTSNHESAFDIFVLATLPIQPRWIAKIQVKYIPILGWTLKLMGSYFVRRSGSSEDIKTMKKVEQDVAHHGKVVVIFPEGTRTKTGEMLAFKKGAFRLAQNSGAPLLPVGIKGTYQIAIKGKMPSQRGFQVYVTIGKPFYISKDENIQLAMEKFRDILIQLRKEEHGTTICG